MSIRIKLTAALTASFFLLAGTTSHAAITWVFNYNDPLGVGFNASGATGADRRAALEQSAATVGALFAAYTATITMDVDGTITDDFTLAAAGSNANLPLTSGFGNPGDVMFKILGGADPNPSGADGVVLWNFEDFMWNTGDSVLASEFDFKSTAIHELLHAVGFLSDIAENGSDLSGLGDSWGPFDEFMADSSGRLIDPNTFMLNTMRWGTASVGGAAAV